MSNLLKHVANAAEAAEEEPVPKKQKTEDTLIPEVQFLTQNKVFYFISLKKR